MPTPICKIAQETGVVPLDCLFSCQRGGECRVEQPHNRDAFGPPMTCSRCGSPRVYWQTVKGEHHLYNRDTLEPHRCPITPLGALPEDE